MNPSIELFRGLAALMVMASHYAQYFGPQRSVLNFLLTGVDLFFVISGFVFAPQVFRGHIEPRGFLVRRFFRIYPLFALSLLAYWAVTPAVADKALYLVRHLFMLHTTASVQEASFFNIAYWSLPPEVEFYLLLPLLAWGLARSGRRLAWVLAGAAVVHVFVFATRQAADQGVGYLSVHLPGLLAEFLLGMAAWRLTAQRRLSAATCVGTGALALAVLAGLALWFVRGGEPGGHLHALGDGLFHLVAAAAYAALVAAGVQLAQQGRAPAPGRWMAWALWAGHVSYGVYLFHNLMPPLTVSLQDSPGARTAVSVAATLGLAWVLRLVYEGPLQAYGARLSKRWSAAREPQAVAAIRS